MEYNGAALIVCESLAPELEDMVPPELSIEKIELGLHDYPKKLNQKIGDTIDKLENEKRLDVILLGFGLCSGGTIGLKSKRARIVVPKTDDCIAIFLGSRSKYQEQFKKEPGTYYYTKGFLKEGAGPLAMYMGEHKWTRNYSKEKAQWIAREMMKNYKRIALIYTGVYDITPYEEKAMRAAEIFGLKYERLTGSLEILKDLINGRWDERFIIVEPWQEITMNMFT